MLTRLFAAQREQIVNAWLAEAGAPGNPGTNGSDPAGRMLRDAAAALYDVAAGQALDPDNPDDHPLLQAVLAFAAWQAAQDRRPESAVSEVYRFKPLFREHLLPQALAAGSLANYLDAESRLDSLAVIVLAEYARCRERLHAARLDALRREQAAVRRWAERHGLDAGGAS